MKRLGYLAFLYVCLLVVRTGVVFAGEQPVDFMVDVGHGVLSNVHGLCSYNELREYYKKIAKDNNVYWDNGPEESLNANNSKTVKNGLYGHIEVDGARALWGSRQFLLVSMISHGTTPLPVRN